MNYIQINVRKLRAKFSAKSINKIPKKVSTRYQKKEK